MYASYYIIDIPMDKKCVEFDANMLGKFTKKIWTLA